MIRPYCGAIWRICVRPSKKSGTLFDLPKKQARLQELEEIQGQPGFWDDQKWAQSVIAEANLLRDQLQRVHDLEKQSAAALDLLYLALDEGDASFLADLDSQAALLQQQVADLELTVLLSGQYDQSNAIVNIHPGAGGTEAQDWAAMLLRMYTRWAERRNYQVEILDYLPGEEAGLKNVTLQINGPLAYGYLRSEKGVHRLVRISPFDSSGRRHTSFASVEVTPEIDNDEAIEILPEDLRIDTYRSGGAGGQHVNKTDSAVRITHLPTGIVVQCQNERSQHSNKETALRMLRSKLVELQIKEQEEALARLRGDIKDIAWGNQIRSYVFHPYSLVKDHRTETEVGNVQAVMDGEIDVFIDAWLRSPLNLRA